MTPLTIASTQDPPRVGLAQGAHLYCKGGRPMLESAPAPLNRVYAKKLLQFQFALSNLRFQKNKKRVCDPLAASFLQLHLLWHDKNREKSSSIGRVISLSRPICKKNTCQCDFYIYAKDSLQLMTKPSLNVKCFIKCYMIHTVHFMSISFKHHANFNTIISNNKWNISVCRPSRL